MAKPDGLVFFQAGGKGALRISARKSSPRMQNVDASGRGYSGFWFALNGLRRKDVDSLLAGAKSAGADPVQAGQEGFLGWLLGLFFPRWILMGIGMESVVSSGAEWSHGNPGLVSVCCSNQQKRFGSRCRRRE